MIVAWNRLNKVLPNVMHVTLQTRSSGVIVVTDSCVMTVIMKCIQ